MIEIRDITKTYKTGDLVQRALDGVSVTFRESEFVAVLGPSGSGKTTFLNIMGGFDHADSGDIVVNGTSTRDYYGCGVGHVPQPSRGLHLPELQPLSRIRPSWRTWSLRAHACRAWTAPSATRRATCARSSAWAWART
ncbi:MAG: ATP-binding cassette domain-containing protein [Collinsella sp.]